MTKKQTSEFGKGLTYCLGLFLCHSERDYQSRGKESELLNRPDLWFNAASDHLYDLQIPKDLPKEIKKRLIELSNKVLHWGHGFDPKDVLTKENVQWAIQEAKDLLLLIDKHFGVETIKGDWE